MSTLVTSLRSIVREDGSSDVLMRRTELQILFSELQPAEVRLLKKLVASITFERDFVPHLPVELKLEITKYLSLSDLINVRNVSNTWRHTWSQISICNQLAERYFRSYLTGQYSRLPNAEKVQALIAGLDRLYSMQLGRYKTMSILPYFQSPTLFGGPPSPILDRKYCNGKVAWVQNSGISVFELRNGVSMRILLPERSSPQMWRISENCLVAVSADKKKLHGWNFDFGALDDCVTASLPSPAKDITIDHNRVGIITIRKEVLIWTLPNIPSGSCSLREFNLTDPMPSHTGFRRLQVLFHPFNVDIIYIVTLSAIQDGEEDEEFVEGTMQWTVQVYHQKIVTDTYAMEIPLQGLDFKGGDDFADSFWLNIRKIDDNGLYSLGPIPVDFPSRLLDVGCEHRWDRRYRRRGHRRHLCTFATFNVYTNKLERTYFHLPGGNLDADFIDFEIPSEDGKFIVDRLHVWNGQLFAPILQFLDSSYLLKAAHRPPVKQALLMAVKSCNQIYGQPKSFPYIAGYGPELVKWNIPGRYATRDLGLAYCWVGDPHLANESRLRDQRDENDFDKFREVTGDGTFVILFGEFDFVVWCYDDTMIPQE